MQGLPVPWPHYFISLLYHHPQSPSPLSLSLLSLSGLNSCYLNHLANLNLPSVQLSIEWPSHWFHLQCTLRALSYPFILLQKPLPSSPRALIETCPTLLNPAPPPSSHPADNLTSSSKSGRKKLLPCHQTNCLRTSFLPLPPFIALSKMEKKVPSLISLSTCAWACITSSLLGVLVSTECLLLSPISLLPLYWLLPISLSCPP